MRNAQLPTQVYFTKIEAAEYLRFSPRAIDALLAQGELKAYRPRRKLLFKREDLDSFIERHLVGVDLNKLVDDTLAELSGSPTPGSEPMR